MSLFNRIRNTASRLASSIIPQSVQRRLMDLGNLLINRVRLDQRLQALAEIVNHVRTNYPPRQSFEVRESNSALRNFSRVYTIEGIDGYDAQSFLQNTRQNIMSVLRNNRRTKVKLIFKCNMERPSNLGETVIAPTDFHSNIEVNLDGTNEEELYDTMVERIIEKMATFQSMVSGWRLHSIIQLELHTVSFNPLRGETWIPLPTELANKKAIINVKNEDKCFLWCVLTALNPKEHNSQIIDKKLKEKENTLNMEGIEYPVSLKDIDKFEKQNPNISVTVFGYNGKSVYPLRNSNNIDREHKIRLMLIEQDGVKHYCLVKNPSRLLSSQTSNYNGKNIFVMGV